MVRSRCTLFLLLCMSITGHAKDVPEDSTVKGTINAVAEAESKTDVKTEEATAVTKAAREVLKSEGQTSEPVPAKVDFDKKTLDKAEDTAEKTFKELKDNGVNTKAAAAAAAEVEIASADGALGEAKGVSVAKEVKLDAEKAAVAAGKAVEDHPHDEGLAMADAVKEVKKEESSGKADLKKTPSKGLLAKATGAVSELPGLAEDGVKKGAHAMGSYVLALLFLPMLAAGFFLYRKHREGKTIMSYIPYMISNRHRDEARALTSTPQTSAVMLQPIHDDNDFSLMGGSDI